MISHYYLKQPGDAWKEVTETEYVQAERAAGFRAKDSLPQDKPATSSFGHSDGLQGKVRYDLKGALKPSFNAVEDKRPLWFGDNPPMDEPPSPV